MTPASDVYQLGLVGYELLTGERPFDPEARERIRAGEDVPPRGGPRWEAVPAPLREVLGRALRLHPEERFHDAAELAEALSAAAAATDDRTLPAAPPLPPRGRELPQPAPLVEAPHPVRPAGKRWEGARAALTALGVALLVFGAVWLLSRTAGSGGGEEPVPAAGALDTAGLAEEFEALEVRAARAEMERLAGER